MITISTQMQLSFIQCLLLFYMSQLNHTLGASLGAKDFSIQLGIGIIEILLAMAYWAIRDEYGSPTKLSTLWLVVWLAISGLLSIGSIVSTIDIFSWYIPGLIKKIDLFVYLTFAQLSMLMLTLNAIPIFIAVKSSQTLHTRFNSN